MGCEYCSPWVIWNIAADNNNAEEQICQIGNFILENMMDDVIIPEDVYENYFVFQQQLIMV